MLDLPPPDPAIEIILSSQGMSKGLRQTEGPQLLIRPELRLGALRIGAYLKNVTSPLADGEGGLSLGLAGRVAGWDLGATATYKRAVLPSGPTDGEALEISASANRSLGPAGLRFAAIFSPDDLGGTGRTLFMETMANIRLRGRLGATASLGRRERDGSPDYWAYNFGLTYEITRFLEAGLRYYDTDRSGLGTIYRPRLILSAKLRF